MTDAVQTSKRELTEEVRNELLLQLENVTKSRNELLKTREKFNEDLKQATRIITGLSILLGVEE